MTNLRKTIVTGLVALLAGCAAPSVQLKKSIPETQTIVQPSEEQIRVDAYGKDVAERAVAFGPEVVQDITSGRIKVELESLPEEVEYLNATYQSASDENAAEITLQCQPEHKECFTDALEHEMGHHLYQALSEAQRTDINVAIIKRLRQPDAEDFIKEITQIDQLYSKLAKILTHQVIPIGQCSKLQKDLAWGEKALKDLEAAGIVYSSTLAADLKATGAKYSSYMPDCTPERLSKAQSEVSLIQKNGEILVQQVDAIYHHKSTSSLELPETEITTTSIQSASQGLDFFKAERAYFDILNALIQERMDSGTIMEDSEAYQTVVNLFVGIQMHQVYQNLSMMDMTMSGLNYAIGGHDSKMEEQFSAAIDSLVDGYTGPITTGPMKLQLDEPLLQALEPLEYKGQKILAPLVERYRQRLQEEEK